MHRYIIFRGHMLKKNHPPRHGKMEELIKMFSDPTPGSIEMLVYPDIAHALREIADIDQYVSTKVSAASLSYYRENVFRLYYHEIVQDARKVKEWASVLHEQQKQHIDEFIIYRNVMQSTLGEVPTGEIRLAMKSYEQLFESVEPSTIIKIIKDGEIVDRIVPAGCKRRRGKREYFVVSKNYQAEEEMAKHLHYIMIKSHEKLDHINFTLSPTLTADQNKVIDSINHNNLTILRGGAGTGKTYVILHILQDWLNRRPNFHVVILTPTNMAADNVRQRLSNALNGADLGNIFIGTLHKYGYNNPHPTNTLIILEEASMYDNVLADTISKGYTDQHYCKYLFVGDENQLPPVSRPSLFLKIINWFHDRPNNIRLAANFRSHDLIVQNSQIILRYAGTNTRLLTSNTFHIRTLVDVAHTQFLRLLYACGYPTGEAINFDKVMFITHRNRDVLYLNKLIRDELYETNPTTIEAFQTRTFPVYNRNTPIGVWEWRIGDKARSLHNCSTISNGSIGRVVGLVNQQIVVRYRDVDTHLHYSKVWPAYCVTVHNSQGQEWDYVCFYQNSATVNKNLFYVAVTRAKKMFIAFRTQDTVGADPSEFNLVSQSPLEESLAEA